MFAFVHKKHSDGQGFLYVWGHFGSQGCVTCFLQGEAQGFLQGVEYVVFGLE